MSFLSPFASLTALLPYTVCVYIVGSANHLVAKKSEAYFCFRLSRIVPELL